jgi:hypothetical protein
MLESDRKFEIKMRNLEDKLRYDRLLEKWHWNFLGEIGYLRETLSAMR